MTNQKRTVENWTVEALFEARELISFPEYQREKDLWTVDKKRLLIDSILKDIDIPKLYFNDVGSHRVEVVDGQQRLWTIWEFLSNDYALDPSIKDSYFKDLPKAKQQQIARYELHATTFYDADDEYLRETFVRLQLGLLLVTGEKLNATTGKMKDWIFQSLVKTRFVKNLGIPARRFAKQTLCAQVCINSFTRKRIGQFARTRYEDLLQFFQEFQEPRGEDLALFKERTQSVEETLEELWSIFGERAKQLGKRSYILSVYLFVEELAGGKSIGTSMKRTLAKFCFQLQTRLREESKLGIERKNRELYAFESMLSSAPGERYQIERRHTKIKEYFEHFEETGKIKGDR